MGSQLTKFYFDRSARTDGLEDDGAMTVLLCEEQVGGDAEGLHKTKGDLVGHERGAAMQSLEVGLLLEALVGDDVLLLVALHLVLGVLVPESL